MQTDYKLEKEKKREGNMFNSTIYSIPMLVYIPIITLLYV